MIHTTPAIVGLVAGSLVPWWHSTALSWVLRIGARGVGLLVGAILGVVSWLTTSKASDLVGVAALVGIVIGVVVSWPGVGVLLRWIVGVGCRSSWLLIGWPDRGWLPRARLLVAGATLADHLALTGIIQSTSLVLKHECLVHQIRKGRAVTHNKRVLQSLVKAFHEALLFGNISADIFRGIP